MTESQSPRSIYRTRCPLTREPAVIPPRSARRWRYWRRRAGHRRSRISNVDSAPGESSRPSLLITMLRWAHMILKVISNGEREARCTKARCR